MRTKVADSTAWRDCLEALRETILEERGVNVEGTMWVVIRPSATPRLGFSASVSAWTTILRVAKEKLDDGGYQLPNINNGDSFALLSVPLVESVRYLYDSITVRRAKR